MPRLKGWLRSRALKRRIANLKLLGVYRPASTNRFVPGSGTGHYHLAVRWPLSKFVHRTYKMVIPEESPDKKFILVVGDCQLRGLVDGYVQMPEGELSFGFLAIRRATVADLRDHLQHTVLPRTPDAVCLLAPSINLRNTEEIKDLREDFSSLLISVCSCCPKVFVLDFPQNLQIPVSKQDLVRLEYRQAAAKMGIRYVLIAKHFPLDRLELWSKDGAHLSDSDGTPLLAQLLWDVTCTQVKGPWPEVNLPVLDESCVAVKKRAEQQEGIVMKDCSVQCSYIFHHYLQHHIPQDSAPASVAEPKAPRRSARLHHQSLVAPKKKTAPVALRSSAPAVAVKKKITTPPSDESLEDTWGKVVSDLWKWDLCEQQPISDEEELEGAPVEWDGAPLEWDAGPEEVGAGPVEVGAGPVEVGAGPVEVGAGPVEVGAGPVEVGAGPVEMGAGHVEWDARPVEMGAGHVEWDGGPVEWDARPEEMGAGPVELEAGPVELEAGPVDDTDASAEGDHMVHVMNFAIEDVAVQVKIEEEDDMTVTPTMQEDFFSSDRQQLPIGEKNFPEKPSVTEENNIGLQADLQVMMYQLEQRDREVFNLRNKLSDMDKNHKAMEEKWQKRINKLRDLLRKRGKESSRVNCKLQLQSRAHISTLVELDNVKSALDRSKMSRKSAEEQFRSKLAQNRESYKRELKEREESLKQRLAIASKREQAILSESWESKEQSWHKKKAELEQRMILKEKLWNDKEAKLEQSIEHLTKQNAQLQKLLDEMKRAEEPLKLLDS